MNKSVKFLFSVLLTFSVLFGMTAVCTAQDDQPSGGNGGLVVHWNFEGEGDEALKNKAPFGEDTTLFKKGNVTVANGTALVPSEAGVYLQASDITDWASGTQATVYVRLKITGDTTSYANFVYGGGSFRMYARKWTNGGYMIEGKTAHTPRLEEINVGFDDETGRWNHGDWIHVALAVNVDAADHHSRLYLSLDGKEWFVKETDPLGSSKKSISELITSDLLFGKANATAAQTAAFEYDDIRIYNRVLMPDEIKMIPLESSVPDVRVIGYQRTVKGGETYGIRFVMGLQDISGYEAVGMTVKAVTEKGTEAAWGGPGRASTTVYQSIVGLENGEEKIYCAADYQASYLYCLTIMDIPASEGVITFHVTPFAIDRDGQQINFDYVTLVPTESK